MKSRTKPTLTSDVKQPVPACSKSLGRIYVRGCDCPSCVERKAFHELNRRMRAERVALYREGKS